MDRRKHLPLTHTTFYILLALAEPLHGYGIMQKVEEMSKGDVKLGPGTLYGALNKLEKDHLIEKTGSGAQNRRKNYQLTAEGKELAILEFERITKLAVISGPIIESIQGEDADEKKGV